MRKLVVAAAGVALILGACKQEERLSKAAAVCGKAGAAPSAWDYNPTIHAPGFLHGTDFEKSLNYTRAIGKKNALLDMLPNELLRIPVSFLASFNGTTPNAAEMDSVIQTANTWSKAGNVQFYRVAKGGVVRIRLTDSAVSSSAVGKEAANISRYSPTMQLGLVRPISSDEREWIIVHEFGHALGLVHEHQNSTMGRPAICWNEPVVRDVLRSVDVQKAIFDEFTGPAYTTRAYDPTSVMVYHAPPNWTCDMRGLPLNHKLSEIDKQTIAELYPRRGLRKAT